MKTKMVAAMSCHWISSLTLAVVAALALSMLVLIPVPAAAGQCEQLFAKYEGSSWWGGAFGNCRKYGGTVDRTEIFECAWKQVPAPENTACLKEKLRTSASTKRHTDAVVAANSVPCDKLYAKYEGSNWWGGAFGNCRKYGGTVDPKEIFECAWKQVPAPENTACLKEKLRTSPSTKIHTKVVIAANKLPTCSELFTKYEGSSWWWGAFGKCKKPCGGTVDRIEIFELAWKQVPAPENITCLKEKLRTSASTKKGIDAVVAYNSAKKPQPGNPYKISFGPVNKNPSGNTMYYMGNSDLVTPSDCHEAKITKVKNAGLYKLRLSYKASLSADKVDEVWLDKNQTTDAFQGKPARGFWRAEFASETPKIELNWQ
jgi:hypothetical protein